MKVAIEFEVKGHEYVGSSISQEEHTFLVLSILLERFSKGEFNNKNGEFTIYDRISEKGKMVITENK